MNPPPSVSSDWTDAKPDTVPRPTYWPALLAFGITFLFWGLVTSWTISAAGLVVVTISLDGWFKEIVHEHA